MKNPASKFPHRVPAGAYDPKSGKNGRFGEHRKASADVLTDKERLPPTRRNDETND